jgi:hypothetical protein
VLDVNVRVESLGEILRDRIKSTRSLSKLCVLLADEIVDDQELIGTKIFLVHCFDGSLSFIDSLEANITVILELANFGLLN